MRITMSDSQLTDDETRSLVRGGSGICVRESEATNGPPDTPLPPREYCHGWLRGRSVGMQQHITATESSTTDHITTGVPSYVWSISAKEPGSVAIRITEMAHVLPVVCERPAEFLPCRPELTYKRPRAKLAASASFCVVPIRRRPSSGTGMMKMAMPVTRCIEAFASNHPRTLIGGSTKPYL